MITTHLVFFFFEGASEDTAVTTARTQPATLAPPLTFMGAPAQHRYLIASAVHNILNGKLNSTGTFTLSANSATTVVKDRRVGVNSIIIPMPTTANAGGEVGVYFTAIGTETDGVPSFTVNHGVDSRTDRTFAYFIVG